jgi:hypothetical protein
MPRPLNPREKASSIYWKGGWQSCSVGLDVCNRGNCIASAGRGNTVLLPSRKNLVWSLYRLSVPFLQWYVSYTLTKNKKCSLFNPNCVFMRPVWLSDQTANIFLYSTKCLVFFYEEEIEFLNNFSIYFVHQRVTVWSKVSTWMQSLIMAGLDRYDSLWNNTRWASLLGELNQSYFPQENFENAVV